MGENINVDEKPEDWKNKLSPAFNEEEILYSLVVLGNFYVVYVIVKASFDVHDNSADDEERFVESCFCSLNQRFFYRFWFGFCSALWFIIHSYSFFAQLSIKRFHQFGDIMKVFLAFCIVCPCYCLSNVNHVYKDLCDCLKQCRSCTCCKKLNATKKLTSDSTVDNGEIKLIRKNISLLWFQYCKLFVIGYTKYYDIIQPITTIMKKSEDRPKGTTKKGEICSDIKIMCYKEYCPKYTIRAILFAVKYLSQLVTVPLLLLQIFDTYSFLCFSPDLYCSHTTEYKQHVVQAAITLFFYCSLVISHLTSTLLIWNPWPKSDEQSKPAPGNVSKVRKKCLFKCKAVQKKFEETFNDNIPWTIYFLVDLKVVYIITFGLITIINLISSTASIHAFTDKSSMTPFNVSSKYMNVNVTSINDPILWNCRQFSEMNDSYQFLYWMVIIVLIVIMIILFLIKFISLIVVNSGCGFKYCTYMGSTFKHGLTKLWYIAIHKYLIDSIILTQTSSASQAPHDQVPNKTITEEVSQGGSQEISQEGSQEVSQEISQEGSQEVSKEISQDDINSYDKMLKEDMPDDVIKTLSYKNYCRSIIPYILLFLSIAIMCLVYFSFDLHPLACLVEPDEELITYEDSKVELKFSTSLLYYQKIGGILVFCLGIIFLIVVRLFFYCTEQVVKELREHIGDALEIEREKLRVEQRLNRQQVI